MNAIHIEKGLYVSLGAYNPFSLRAYANRA
nr:MAG TPA: hypothetical protein [Caudoviricetes sp.]